MSYIPDYRGEEGKLTEKDRAFWEGYKAASEDACTAIDNAVADGWLAENAAEELKMFIDCSETEMILAIFEGPDYENIELKDGNPPLYTGTKGDEEGA